MNMRVIVAGTFGGVALFAWGFVSHVILPLGEQGIKKLPKEEPVLEAMRANITEPGLYIVPGMAPGQHGDEAAIKEWTEKANRGPVALLVYQLRCDGAMTVKQLVLEGLSNIAIGLLAAMVVSYIACGFLLRTLLVGAMGLMSSLDILVSEWNWYAFPLDYTLAQMTMQVAGFLIMGFAVALIVKRPQLAA